MITIEGNNVRFNEHEIRGDYPVQEARLVDQMILVLYRPDSRKSGQFRNLVAFDLGGSLLWEAELPTTSSMDSYYQLVSHDPIVADSYCSYRCTIDAANGRLTNKEFFK